MPGAGEEDDVRVLLPDEPVEVNVDEAEAGRGSPVAQEARLDMFGSQGLLEQCVVLQVDLAHGQVVGSLPVAVQSVEQFRR